MNVEINGELVEINVIEESCVDAMWVSKTDVPIKRIELNDDGSMTVIVSDGAVPRMVM
jgi:hypothetical protein